LTENEPIPEDVPRNVGEQLQQHGQTQLLRWWEELNTAERNALLEQIRSVDFTLLDRLMSQRRQDTASGADDSAQQLTRAIAERAEPPRNLVRLPRSTEEQSEYETAASVGREMLAAGQVGAILVAGGQGSRLGFHHPKGMFPIGPVSDRSLYQLLAEQLLARSDAAKCAIPYFVMTSAATHDETVDFFKTHRFFGLEPDDVFFFQQGTMPAVDAKTGRILLAGKGSLALSPDGHGGVLAAMQRAGLFDEMRQRGVEFLYYHQVDNPAAVVCDPVFLGFHKLRQSELSTKVVAKTSPGERMGAVVTVDGEMQIIEYSDLPADLQPKTDADGKLLFWAGSTAIHVFNREFLERMAADPSTLPFHVALKKSAYVNDSGETVPPDTENAVKFERFVFDVLPHAANALVVEANRADEFLPVKKAEGTDSPETARAGLTAMYTRWLESAGVEVAAETAVEISPLFAVDAAELRSQPDLPDRVGAPTVFGPSRGERSMS